MARLARADLSRHGKPVESVFDLLGWQENDLTAALGFTLAGSALLRGRLVDRFEPERGRGPIVVRMETADRDGRTDLELDTGAALIVVEAKRGWRLPTRSQLEKYASRVLVRGKGSLVTLSDCSPSWAAQKLPRDVEGVAVRHLPWSEVRADLESARSRSRGTERLWLTELSEYLRRAVRVTDPASSWTYCVSLSRNKPGGGGPHSFIGFVRDANVYFHPFGWGSGWPVDAPNFMAFRWGGKVREVRRVIAHDVMTSLQERWPSIPRDDSTTRPHSIYTLGPPLPMHEPLPSGTNYRASRFWVLLDQLLTNDTLKDALAGTRALTELHGG